MRVAEIVCVVLSVVVGLHCVDGAKINDPCVKISSCSCKNSLGTYDLSAIGLKNETARFVISIPGDNFVYYWNPCYGFTYPPKPLEDVCTNVAICIANATFYDNVGGQESAEFVYYANKKMPVIKYTHRRYAKHDTATLKTAYVLLECSKEDPGIALAAGEVRPGEYEFAYRGVHGCPVNIKRTAYLSVGSVLLIIALCMVSLYFLVGVPYQKFAKEEEGWRLIPNPDVWQAVVLDIKGGMFFAVTCGQPIQSVAPDNYDKM